ncbi:Protein TolB [Planctomycetes bacterium Pan216]|uniref:Protein TolB n=1 Tax=Kolteria novifilia TaxID=2527975 RepID=A0A518BAE7_9BACT|nr:Protein TolB [Planctomycetes bacterium Pan216]
MALMDRTRYGVTLLLSGCFFVPGIWSPDGSEIAFLTQTVQGESIFSQNWLFGRGDGAALVSSGAVEDPGVRVEDFDKIDSGDDLEDQTVEGFDRPCPLLANEHTSSELWIANPRGGARRRLVRSQGLLSNPSWAPDGGYLVYMEFLPESDAPASETSAERYITGTLALRRHHRLGKTETIVERAVTLPASSLAFLPDMAPDVAPTGMHVAVPWIDSMSLDVLKLSGGDHLATIEHATRPSWSPDGQYLACLHLLGDVPDRIEPEISDEAHLYVHPVDDLEQGVRILANASASQTANWDSSGNSLVAIHHDDAGIGIPSRHLASERARLVRAMLNGSEEQPILTPTDDLRRGSRPKGPVRLYHVVLPAARRIFTIVQGPKVPSQVNELDLSFGGILRSWHPLDNGKTDLIPLGSLSASSRGDFLALRYGIPEVGAPLGLIELSSGKLTTWTPDAASTERALWAIGEAVKRTVLDDAAGERSPFRVAGLLPAVERRERSYQGPTGLEIFPTPLEQSERTTSTQAAIDRLAAHGLELLDRYPSSPSITQTRQRRLEEVRLLLAYARRDYESALDALTAIERLSEAAGTNRDQFLLAVVKAQCWIGLNRRVPARSLVANLLAERRRLWNDATRPVDSESILLVGIPSATNGPRNEEVPSDDPILSRLNGLMAACQPPDPFGEELVPVNPFEEDKPVEFAPPERHDDD